MDVVLGDLVKLLPVWFLCVREHGVGDGFVGGIGAVAHQQGWSREEVQGDIQIISHCHCERHVVLLL